MEREYRIWKAMRSRCNNPHVKCYKHYGGRGIRVCSRWDTYANFITDMGPSQGLTLSRIDNDKDYEPGNCEWATLKKQANNKRNNRIVVLEGVTATLKEHCERLHLKYQTIYMRLYRGASVEEAFCLV